MSETVPFSATRIAGSATSSTRAGQAKGRQPRRPLPTRAKALYELFLLAATAVRALTATPASTATPTSTAAPAAVSVMAAAGMCDRRTVKRCGEEKRYGWRCDDRELSTGCQEFAAIRVRVILGSALNFRHADSSYILTTAH